MYLSIFENAKICQDTKLLTNTSDISSYHIKNSSLGMLIVKLFTPYMPKSTRIMHTILSSPTHTRPLILGYQEADREF